MKHIKPIGLALRSLGSLVIIGMLMGGHASAQIFYTNVALYDNASKSRTLITFNGQSNTYTTENSPYSVTSFGGYTTTFSVASGDNLAIFGSQFGTGSYAFPAGTPATLDVQTSEINDTLTITLPANMTSFAFDVAGATSTAAITATVKLADGTTEKDSFTAPKGSSGFDFLGINSTDGVAIQSVTINDATNFPNMVVDNVQFGEAIPEPKTYALLGLAGVVLLAFRRRFSLV